MKFFLSIDIGASSGRHILGKYDGEKLFLEEIYRFENGVVESEQGLVWDIASLTSEVIKGIAKCSQNGIIPQSISIDTWGVDYVLLNKDKKELLPVFAYRNSRTDDIPLSKAFPLSPEQLYSKTGTQLQSFNTVYQLYCDKLSGKLDKAAHFLMIPDYLAFKLTGVMKNEYTNATTTGMVNAQSKELDREILEKVGIPADIFEPLSAPGTVVGTLLPEIREQVGFDCPVVLCGSHDTASAVAACPIDENSLYISSGTWSLVGTENFSPVTSPEALVANFTNEGGVEYRFRFLKNIMGMWLFQNIRRNLYKEYTYDQLMHMAKRSRYSRMINPNDASFTAPESMIEAVRSYLKEPDLPIADVVKSVYISVANSYKETINQIEQICGKNIDRIIIVGGGSKDEYLNSLTAECTGKKVYTGISEGTATGNILVQIMASENITLAQAREIVSKSFSIKQFDIKE